MNRKREWALWWLEYGRFHWTFVKCLLFAVAVFMLGLLAPHKKRTPPQNHSTVAPSHQTN